MKIILSLDGGGIRGIISAIILSDLEKRLQKLSNNPDARITDYVDLIAGTSTGAIIASLLAAKDRDGNQKYTAEEVIYLYRSLAPKIFSISLSHRIRTLWGLIGPKYSSKPIEEELLRIFGDSTLSDLRIPAVFTSYDIDRRCINIYTNRDKERKYSHYLIRDVVRGSSSIPAFFPPAYFRRGIEISTLIDGGIFANNPSMVAFIEASKVEFHEGFTENIMPSDTLLLSIGTGISPKKSYPWNSVRRRGVARWIFPILDIILSASADCIDYQMKRLFLSYSSLYNYVRISPPIESISHPTDASKKNIEMLIGDAKKYIEENDLFLDSLAKRIWDSKTRNLF